jgi:hypothetical protein
MRTSLLCLYVVLQTALVQAQIEVSITDFPVKNDTVRFSLGTDLDLDYFSTGADYTWDFEDLNASGQQLLNHLATEDADVLIQNSFGITSPPTYRASYFIPATDLPFDQFGLFLPVNIENLYRFFRRTNTSLNIIGLSLVIEGFGLSARSDTIEVAYELPMTFGDSWQSVGYTKLDFSVAFPAQFAQHRQRSSEVDGYGMLTTPYGTFEAIRVHHVINEIDSLLIDFGGGVTPIAIPITTHEYEWWTNEQKGPLLKVVANEIAGNEVVTSVQFRDVYREELVAGMADMAKTDFQVYPNPTKETCSVKLQENGLLRVVDLTGKTIMEQPVSSGLSLINTAEWASGTYVVFFKSSQGTQAIQRIIKE